MKLKKSFDFDEGSVDVDDSVKDVANDELFREDLGFDGGFSGSGVSPMDKHSDLLKGLTDFEPFMKTLVSEWLGLVWSESAGKYVDDVDVSPTMNVYGARWCINFLRVYTRGNNIITNLDTFTYNDIIGDVVETVFLNVGCRAEEFCIESDGDILKVANQLIHSVILILVGTGGSNNYKDLLSKSTNRNENVNISDGSGGNFEPGRNKGFFQSFGEKLRSS